MIASTGVFVEALDISIINLAVPAIQRSFSLSNDKAYLLQSLYVLIYGGFLMLGGKLSDVWGKKNVFLAGAVLFLITSLGAGFSGSFYVLLFFRALQGLAAALIMPAAFAIVNHYYQGPGERGKAIGVFSSFAAVGSGSGLAVGGIVASTAGWPWVFFINVPVLLVVIIAGYTYLAADTPDSYRVPDLFSGILLVIAMVLLTLTFEFLSDIQQYKYWLIGCVLLVAISFYWLYIRLKQQQEPLIDLRLFSIPSLTTGNLLFIVLGAIFTGYLFVISLTLQQNFHFNAARSGLTLVPFSILSALVARFMLPFMIDKMGNRNIAVTGMAFMLAGSLFLLFAIQHAAVFLLLCAAASVAGFGMTLCFTSFSVMAMQQVPSAYTGIGGSLTTTAYFIGGGLGLPLLSLFMSKSSVTMTAPPAMVLCAFAVVGLLIIAYDLSRKYVTEDSRIH